MLHTRAEIYNRFLASAESYAWQRVRLHRPKGRRTLRPYALAPGYPQPRIYLRTDVLQSQTSQEFNPFSKQSRPKAICL